MIEKQGRHIGQWVGNNAHQTSRLVHDGSSTSILLTGLMQGKHPVLGQCRRGSPGFYSIPVRFVVEISRQTVRNFNSSWSTGVFQEKRNKQKKNKFCSTSQMWQETNSRVLKNHRLLANMTSPSPWFNLPSQTGEIPMRTKWHLRCTQYITCCNAGSNRIN